LAELKKRDDAWLMAVDPKFGDGKQNSILTGNGFMYANMSLTTGGK
jgi:hypothetical protein